jgi:hypothetical protein
MEDNLTQPLRAHLQPLPTTESLRLSPPPTAGQLLRPDAAATAAPKPLLLVHTLVVV